MRFASCLTPLREIPFAIPLVLRNIRGSAEHPLMSQESGLLAGYSIRFNLHQQPASKLIYFSVSSVFYISVLGIAPS